MCRLVSSCYFELVRISRDRGFWFWSLIGMPILVPLLVIGIAVVMSVGASSGEPKQASAGRPIVLLDAYVPPFSPFVEAQGLKVQRVSKKPDIANALSSGDFQLAVHAHDDGLFPRTLEVVTPVPSSRHLTSTLESLQKAIDAYHRVSVEQFLEGLPNMAASTALLSGPPAIVLSSSAPTASRSTLAVTLILWAWLLVLPYFQLARIGSSYVVSDLQRGLLSTSAISGQSMWSFSLVRSLTLSSLGAVLLVAYFILMLVWMAVYSSAADWLVANGVLDRLSADRSSSMTVALVDVVAQWRSLPSSFFLSTLLIALAQLFSISAVLVAGSTYANSVPRSRLYEMLPFALVFLVPLLSISVLRGLVPATAAYVPGLSAVVLIDALADGMSVTYLMPFLVSNLLLFLLALFLTTRRASSESFWLGSYS